MLCECGEPAINGESLCYECYSNKLCNERDDARQVARNYFYEWLLLEENKLKWYTSYNKANKCVKNILQRVYKQYPWLEEHEEENE